MRGSFSEEAITIRVAFLYSNRPDGRFAADSGIGFYMPKSIRLLKPAFKAVSAEIGIGSALPA